MPLILSTTRGFFIIFDTPDFSDTIGPLPDREAVRAELEKLDV